MKSETDARTWPRPAEPTRRREGVESVPTSDIPPQRPGVFGRHTPPDAWLLGAGHGSSRRGIQYGRRHRRTA